MYIYICIYVYMYICIYIYVYTQSSKMAISPSRHSKELKDPTHARTEIKLDPHEEDLLLDTIVYAESMNIWAAELDVGWYGGRNMIEIS